VPKNYDRQFTGWVSLRTALAGSLNVPAVRTLMLLGPDPFADRRDEFVGTVTGLGALHDAGQCAHIAAGIPAADLQAAADQHNAEGRFIGGQAVLHQAGIAGLENPQWQGVSG
jgi:hypothetical protein